jgi:hypothetical protein
MPAPILMDAANIRFSGQNATILGWGDRNTGETPLIMEAALKIFVH